jgi:hypothetical protein
MFSHKQMISDWPVYLICKCWIFIIGIRKQSRNSVFFKEILFVAKVGIIHRNMYPKKKKVTNHL